jgi:hypothetical protein
MVYKHAISTIVPARNLTTSPFEFNNNNTGYQGTNNGNRSPHNKPIDKQIISEE